MVLGSITSDHEGSFENIWVHVGLSGNMYTVSTHAFVGNILGKEWWAVPALRHVLHGITHADPQHVPKLFEHIRNIENQ